MTLQARNFIHITVYVNIVVYIYLYIDARTNKLLFTEHYVIRTDPLDTVIKGDRLSPRFTRKIFAAYYSDMTSVLECDVAVLVR